MLTNTPGYQPKITKIHLIAATGQYHGCTECGKLTWHRREKRINYAVLKCTECEKGRIP